MTVISLVPAFPSDHGQSAAPLNPYEQSLHLASTATSTANFTPSVDGKSRSLPPPPPPPLPPSLPLPPTPSKWLQTNGRLHLKNANWEKFDCSDIVGTIWENVRYSMAKLIDICIS